MSKHLEGECFDLIEETKTVFPVCDACADRGFKYKLSDRDRDLFLGALENPPEPNEALKNLVGENKMKKLLIGSGVFVLLFTLQLVTFRLLILSIIDLYKSVQ